MIGTDLLRRRGHIASIGRAEVADHAGMGLEVAAKSVFRRRVLGFISAESMNAIHGIVPSPVVFQLRQEGVIAGIAEIIEERISVIDGSDPGDWRALVRGSIRHDEPDSRCICGMSQQHFFDEDAAQAMRDENYFAMLPNVVLLEAGPKDVGQLHTGHPAIRRRRGILRDFNVGIGEARVRPNHIRPIGAIRGSPGLAAPVKAMHKNNDSCPRGWLRLVLLYSGLGKGRGSLKKRKQGDQNKLDLPVYPTVSTHLEPGI